MTVTVRYFAGAGAAAGVPEERVVLAAGSTTADLVRDAGLRRGPDLVRVSAACSVLVDGRPDHDRSLVLADGATVDLLPPFAGG